LADIDKNPAKPWSLYVGTMVMAGMTVISGINSGVAAAVGSSTVARTSLGTAFAFAAAALGSLAYVLWRGRNGSS
jgi:hypothetical protein